MQKILLWLFLNKIIITNSAKIQLANCNCGNFIQISSINQNNEININEDILKNLIEKHSAIGRKIYAIGNLCETEILERIILKELYTNFDATLDPECRGAIVSPCIDEKTEKSRNYSIELWNDVFLYDAMNGSQIAIIFINFKTLEENSEFLNRQISAFSSFLSSIFFFIGEKRFYDENFGDESQECDFYFNIDENDKRDEIDASVLEIRSILSPQNFDLHESIHFTEEDLSLQNFVNLLNLAEIDAGEVMKMIKQENEEISKNNGKFELENPEFSFLLRNFSTTPKVERKIKIFLKKLSKIEKTWRLKVEKVLKRQDGFLRFMSQPDENVRRGVKRNFIKTLKQIFSDANQEIFKSKTFAKLLRDEKITIPLACDVKC